MTVELHKVARGSRIRVVGEAKNPPSHRTFVLGEELEFSHIDGMYSLCRDDEGQIVHLVAWAKVEVLRDGPA